MVLFIVGPTSTSTSAVYVRWCRQHNNIVALTEQLFSGQVAVANIPLGPKPGSDRTIKHAWNLHFAKGNSISPTQGKTGTSRRAGCCTL